MRFDPRKPLDPAGSVLERDDEDTLADRSGPQNRVMSWVDELRSAISRAPRAAGTALGPSRGRARARVHERRVDDDDASLQRAPS